MVWWRSRSGWRVEEATLDRGHGPEHLIRLTRHGAPEGWGSPGLPRGWYRTVDDMRAACPDLPWGDLEEQPPEDDGEHE